MSHQEPSRHVQHHGMGVFYAILAALFTALIALAVKLIGIKASTNTVIFVRYFLSFCFILPWAIKDAKEIIQIDKPLQTIFRSLFTLLATGGIFYALKYIPLTNTLLLSNSSPLFVPLILRLAHKTTTPHKVWLGILLGFFGLIFVLQPDPHGFHLPAIFALMSGIFGAFATILIRLLTHWASVIQILFYNLLIGTLITGICIPFFATASDWVSLIPLFLLVGFFGVGYQIFSTLALARAPAQLIAPIVFASVVFGVPLDYIFWGTVPDLFTCVGVVAVIAGGLITIHYGRKHLAKK